MLALFLAAALSQAEPAAALASTAPPISSAQAEAEADTPKGAPATDYDFVAWCHGALSGHMALYAEVKPELDGLSRASETADNEKTDHAQMEAGREYLALYTRALNGADKGHAALLARRRTAQAQGSAIWTAARAAEPRTRMWSWLLWDLPGRCETAAKTLETPAGRIAALHSKGPGIGAYDAAQAQVAPGSIDAALGAAGPAGSASTGHAAAPVIDGPAEAGQPAAPSSSPISTGPEAVLPPAPSSAAPEPAPTLRGPQ